MFRVHVPTVAGDDFSVIHRSFFDRAPRKFTFNIKETVDESGTTARDWLFRADHRYLPSSYFDHDEIFCYPSILSIGPSHTDYQHTVRGTAREIAAFRASATEKPEQHHNSLSCIIAAPIDTVPEHVSELFKEQDPMSLGRNDNLPVVPSYARPLDIEATFLTPFVPVIENATVQDADDFTAAESTSVTGRCKRSPVVGRPPSGRFVRQ